MKFYIIHVLVVSMTVLLASCGGRVSNLVSEETASDIYFTCSHISGEYEMNLAKIQDLRKEKRTESTNNVGMLLMAPLFLDLKNTEQKEIAALYKRNERLTLLAEGKGCTLIDKKS